MALCWEATAHLPCWRDKKHAFGLKLPTMPQSPSRRQQLPVSHGHWVGKLRRTCFAGAAGSQPLDYRPPTMPPITKQKATTALVSHGAVLGSYGAPALLARREANHWITAPPQCPRSPNRKQQAPVSHSHWVGKLRRTCLAGAAGSVCSEPVPYALQIYRQVIVRGVSCSHVRPPSEALRLGAPRFPPGKGARHADALVIVVVDDLLQSRVLKLISSPVHSPAELRFKM